MGKTQDHFRREERLRLGKFFIKSKKIFFYKGKITFTVGSLTFTAYCETIL